MVAVAGACLALPRAAAGPDQAGTCVGLESRAGSMVTPEWLAKTPDVLLFHVAWGGARDDRRAHIPGAIHFDTNRIERPPL